MPNIHISRKRSARGAAARPMAVTSPHGSLVLLSLLLAAACARETVETPEMIMAHAAAVSELQMGRLPEAEEQFRKILEDAPNHPGARANLGLTYLRAARYDEAEKELERARRLAPKSTEVGLMLARLYQATGRRNEARELLQELPPDARVHYALAELETDSARATPPSPARLTSLRAALAAAPANLAVRLELAEALARTGANDSAAAQLEEIRRLRPEAPPEARPPLDSAIQYFRTARNDRAQPQLDRFASLVRVTQPYQAALEQVQWVEGPLVGRPILSFTPQSVIQTRGIIAVARDTALSFTDVSDESDVSQARYPSAIAIGDHDNDGSDNLVFGARGADGAAAMRLFNVMRGYVVDATDRAALALRTTAAHASFADVDNDGWLDLYVAGTSGDGHLLRNNGAGAFQDVTARARLSDAAGARRSAWVDVDHDGDLDLILAGGALRVFRNNMDGSFTESAAALGLATAGATHDVAFGDLDGDARTDLVVARVDGGIALYRNTAGGQRRFEDVTSRSGLQAGQGPAALVVTDFDNDGFLDILAAHGTSGGALWLGSGDGTFPRDARSAGALRALAAPDADVRALDYDNDGWLDVVAGSRRGLALLRNDGRGRLTDSSRVLSRTAVNVPVVAVLPHDADGDGDLDLLVADSSRLRLLRNDGGNASLSMQVQLVGLRTGSGKNNTFGIGSRVEVRSGAIYQTRVVTSRVTHFGLGPHLKADVLRIEWTNGVPQTVYFPGTDEDVLELEQLKGSCGFLYTWDGTRFRFVTDVMWRSALGMPMGIMGATSRTAYAPAQASQEYLRIPGDALRPRNGKYVLQFTEELWEVAYLDDIKLLAVDHPDSVEVFVDERFIPPHVPVRLRMSQAARRHAPLSAVDERGRDVLPALRERDDVYVSNFTPTRYQGVVEPHELVMDLGPAAGGRGTQLFLRGWIYPSDASINVALGQQQALKVAMPSLEVSNARGQWQTAIANIGFPSGKDKTIVLDLEGLFPTPDHRVRIRTNMQIYWDQAFVATDAASSDVKPVELTPVSADLHGRGFSRMYRKGGRFGPHWFDYGSVTTESPWRSIEGAFTRFGDVLPLLRGGDDMYVIMAPGDEATVEFTAPPPPRTGWKRTFLLYTDGWIKDADLNTAFGNTVEPLPYHAITSYPYAPGDAYPADSARQRYLREYNTRRITRIPRVAN